MKFLTSSAMSLTYSIFFRTFILLLLINMCCIISHTFAQSGRQVLEMEKRAKEYYMSYQFRKALEIYKQLDSLFPGNFRYMYRIAVSYLSENKNELALPYLESCLKIEGKQPPELNYYLGRAYHLSHRLDEAIEYYEKYNLVLRQKASKNSGRIAILEREIGMCRNGKEFMASPVDVEVINIGKEINSSYDDYAPVLTGDERLIFFTSDRPNSRGLIDETDGMYFEDIYYSEKSEEGLWKDAQEIGDSINTSGHDASVSLTPEGRYLLLYRYDHESLISSGSGNLYLAEMHGKSWKRAVKLPDQINSRYWESSACLSPDGSTLFFTSNRPGGMGGTDIYYVKKINKDIWGQPVNLGNKINSPYDEDSPFLHPNGKILYFCSNGHKTMGGFDVFVSSYNEEKNEWSAPENMGYPISTAHDDLHLTWTADGKRFYFSSVRPEGYGDRDIYYGNIEKEAARIMVVKGNILDENSFGPIAATIIVKDKKNGELIGIFNSNSATGNYFMVISEGKDYIMSVEAEGYLAYSEEIHISHLSEFREIFKNIILKPRPE